MIDRLTLTLSVVLSFLAGASDGAVPGDAAFTLTLQMPPSPADGELVIELFDAPGNWPHQPLRTRRTTVKAGQPARLAFADMPPGRIGVLAYLDRNLNHRWDAARADEPRARLATAPGAGGGSGAGAGTGDAGCFEHVAVMVQGDTEATLRWP
ncbi:DUF2141 domain-containing protein [Ideonella sp.]|uniref:DUF2141 domain-containing protein n=1 Tax=Ideonella sp. TaxID=1929293 RepID=UPI0035B0CF77